MTKPKQVRWQCPNGHAAVLGPQRPRRDNACRYCLPCTAKAGKLVERTAPALDAKRSVRAEASKTKAGKRAATEAARQKARYSVGDRDMRDVMKKALSLPAFKAAKGYTDLTIQRKADPHLSGNAQCWGKGGIFLGLSNHPSKLGAELEATGLLLHEIAHIACWREGKPFGDADTYFAHKCEEGMDQWNKKHNDEIDHEVSGAYRGKIGRRNKRAGTRRLYAADEERAAQVVQTPAAARAAKIKASADRIKNGWTKTLDLADEGLTLRIPPSVWGEFTHFVIETVSSDSSPARQRMVEWVETHAQRVGKSYKIVLPRDEEIRREFVSELEYAIDFHAEAPLVAAHALMWAKATTK